MRILYLDIDSLRPDHIGCYGYHRDTSPNIDRLAAEGLRFSNYYASDAPCLPSRTSFFGGRFGLTTGVINHGGACADLLPEGQDRGFRSSYAATSLGAVLREAGYWTASISPFPWRHTAYQVWHGFNETIDTGKGGLENADEIYPFVREWLGRYAGQDNWFLHVNLWDPHTPYDTPASFGNPFEDDPIEDWLTEELIQRQRQSYGPHSATELPGIEPKLSERWTMGVPEIRNREDAKRHFDGYDTGIRYADHHVGLILELLKRLKIADKTAVILSADHGESHGELNVWGDHQTADQACSRVPLILRWPGVTDELAGKEHTGLYYNIDFTPTLCELAGAKPSPAWDGISFAQRLAPDAQGRPFLVLSQGAWSLQRSVRWQDWLLIHTVHTGMKEFREWMLFHLATDPHETTDLAPKRPEVVAEGRNRLEAWLAEHSTRAVRGDPFEIVLTEGGPHHANEKHPNWAAYCQRLRATGREDHAKWLELFAGRPRE